MTVLSYHQQDLPIRQAILEAHTAATVDFTKPGTWLTAKQRMAVLQEIRYADRCRLCADRKQALSPYQLNGEHDDLGELSPPIIEVIHRIKTDSGRLTAQWFNSITLELSREAYIEVIGLLATTVIMDSYAKGLGVSRFEPNTRKLSSDAPSKVKTTKVINDGAWLPLMQVAEDNTSGAMPKVPNILRAMGLVPSAVQSFFLVMRAHYSLAAFPTDLSRMQVELLASRMSAYNDCFY